MSSVRKDELAAAANLSCPLLSLSNEIITSIVYDLRPREAIFLSLTCRALFYGVLSSQNYYLWFKVGRFSEHMPGHKAEWMLMTNVDLFNPGPGKGQTTSLHTQETPASKSEGNGKLISADKGKKKATSKKPTRKGLARAAKSYCPAEAVVNYKQLLVDTMIGNTDSGCQWCLAKPMTRKIYDSWKIRLCEPCFWDNVITKHACKQLGIDTSHLPVQDVKRQGGVLHGVWKPAVQRLVNANSGGKSQPVERLITEYKSKKQDEKNAAAEALSAYWERHFIAIFECIIRQYREIYDRHAATGFRDSAFARLLEKIPPERLKLEWFMFAGRSHRWNWKQFYKNEALMTELKTGKGGEKWKEPNWAEQWAAKKITKMETMFTTNLDASSIWQPLTPAWDIPTNCMVQDVNALVKDWHVQRVRDSGVQDPFARVSAATGGGHLCPWTGCYSYHPDTRGLAWDNLENFLSHLRMYHREIFFLGDTDWLVGRPCRWWLRNVPHADTPGGAREDEDNGSDYFKPEVCQAAWLRQWWPDRWREENTQILEEWRDNGGFFGGRVEILNRIR